MDLLGVGQIHDRVQRDEPAQGRVVLTCSERHEASGGTIVIPADEPTTACPLFRAWARSAALLPERRRTALGNSHVSSVDGELTGAVVVGQDKRHRAGIIDHRDVPTPDIDVPRRLGDRGSPVDTASACASARAGESTARSDRSEPSRACPSATTSASPSVTSAAAVKPGNILEAPRATDVARATNPRGRRRLVVSAATRWLPRCIHCPLRIGCDDPGRTHPSAKN